MVGHTKVRLGVCAALVSLNALSTASVGAATTASGAQDPNMRVSVSIVSSGANPNVALVGDEVRAVFSVTPSSVFQTGIVNLIWDGDWAGSKLGFAKTKLVKMRSGRTWDWEVKVRVRGNAIPGTYNLFGAAETQNGPLNTDSSQCNGRIPLMGSCAIASIQVGMAGATAMDLGAFEAEAEDDNDKTDE